MRTVMLDPRGLVVVGFDSAVGGGRATWRDRDLPIEGAVYHVELQVARRLSWDGDARPSDVSDPALFERAGHQVLRARIESVDPQGGVWLRIGGSLSGATIDGLPAGATWVEIEADDLEVWDEHL